MEPAHLWYVVVGGGGEQKGTLPNRWIQHSTNGGWRGGREQHGTSGREEAEGASGADGAEEPLADAGEVHAAALDQEQGQEDERRGPRPEELAAGEEDGGAGDEEEAEGAVGGGTSPCISAAPCPLGAAGDHGRELLQIRRRERSSGGGCVCLRCVGRNVGQLANENAFLIRRIAPLSFAFFCRTCDDVDIVRKRPFRVAYCV